MLGDRSVARRKSGGSAETIRTVLYAVLIAIAVRTFLYEPFNIPSGSMKPTLLIGDYLFVSKASYGYSRYSLPFGLPLFSGRIWETPPERGDVAVFKLPSDGKTDYIKRIIGLPGDKIRVVNGILEINGVPVQRERIEDYVEEGYGGTPIRMIQYIETLPNGVKHRIIEESDEETYDNTPVYEVPAGHYFAMGDNRDNSLDSRVSEGVGFIPEQNLVGRAEFLFFSTDGSASLWEFWKWPSATRFARLFTGIH
jgi:signal peptidase I